MHPKFFGATMDKGLARQRYSNGPFLFRTFEGILLIKEAAVKIPSDLIVIRTLSQFLRP